ncbi:hypothetical protein PhCBS80983_g02409 [Powellomyces hirtus]|uniref:Uncharacterized protein n=1 Tax=Powellomyces hirtus TaxID=109895 RepID=A0A507E8T9_9FUNG|nr:hypothetical protein PhCBS80983_g02409 [Powellomyces hirtus]
MPSTRHPKSHRLQLLHLRKERIPPSHLASFAVQARVSALTVRIGTVHLQHAHRQALLLSQVWHRAVLHPPESSRPL